MSQADIDLLITKNAVGSITWEKDSGPVRAFLHEDLTWTFEGDPRWCAMYKSAIENKLIDFPQDSPSIAIYDVFMVRELAKRLDGRPTCIPGTRNSPPPGCVN